MERSGLNRKWGSCTIEYFNAKLKLVEQMAPSSLPLARRHQILPLQPFE